VCEYATPSTPFGAAALVNVGVELGVPLTVAEAAPAPTALFARTEHVYSVPLARPLTVTGLAAPEAVTAPGLQVTL
jgi:hypothetical protein